MLDTAATRRPATTAGTESGSSTTNRRFGVYPIAVAEFTTTGGTALSASATVRTSSATV